MGWVYLIGERENKGKYKIGSTRGKDVNNRLSQVPNNLKSFYERETSLLYMLDGIDGINLKYNGYYCIYNRGVLIINEQWHRKIY